MLSLRVRQVQRLLLRKMADSVAEYNKAVDSGAVEVSSNPANSEDVPSHLEGSEINEKNARVLDTEVKAGPPVYDGPEEEVVPDDAVIVTGADAANYLLPLRDDHDPALTFRGLFLATILSGWQAAMTQIYNFKPTAATVSGTFIVIIAYFLGNAWAAFLPRGEKLEARWRAKGNTGRLPLWITIAKFINTGPFSLKEHAVCSITANSASNGNESITVFAAQSLFYNLPLTAGTVVMTTLSIGLFGYGIAGIIRPIAVWHPESVYWGTLPLVKTLQGLHWQKVKNSKPLRYFWYAFAGMSVYEWFPAYIWPWLNSVSIPCLASMHATGAKAEVLTNLFGGSLTNEGLGLFNFGFDWQYITSFQTSLPLKLQVNMTAGLIVCYIVMIAIYYGNGWGARSLPFMSTDLLMANGTTYPVTEVFSGGVLDESLLEYYGIPKLSGSFAYAMFIGNAAIGAMIMHCLVFWGKDTWDSYRKNTRGESADRHHRHMAKHYNEVPAWWYIAILVFSFILGLVTVLKENITLPVWAYIVSLILGAAIGPFSTLIYARYGNGIATNNLSKLVAGLVIPGLPVGNMYFAAWSHNVVANVVNLCNDLKLGEYLKIPPRTMFITQIYGTVLGAFINYGVMIGIVSGNRELLVDGNGDAAWSGATMQAYNTNAASWALSKYLYKAGKPYDMVPAGLAIGAGCVLLHRAFAYFYPKIKGLSVADWNFPQFIQYAGYIPYNSPQTCTLANQIVAGFLVQYYIRNYHPRIFRDYMYLVTGAFDGAAFTVVFILSFAVFGAGGKTVPFPAWWGNNVNGNYDFCPVTSD